MKNELTQKQWWTPVWMGLVMDPEAKHYHSMKSAVWLYLYLLVNANRRTGILYRKIKTVSNDMGVTRDTVRRWFSLLRNNGYIKTINTGRSLTILVTRWKPLPGVRRIQHQKLDNSNFRYGKYPLARNARVPPFPSRQEADSGFAGAANDTNIKINITNDMRRSIVNQSTVQEFTSIGASIGQDRLAWELAEKLNDLAGIRLYKSYCARYPEWLLRKVLMEVQVLPPERITKGRGALFNYLIQHYAKGTTKNSGD